MTKVKLIVWLLVLFVVQQEQQWRVAANSVALTPPSRDPGGSSSSLGPNYSKSRQSRCVRCYDDRYGDDRSRYGGGGGGYSGRSTDDRGSSSWYYPNYERYDRYDDRYRSSDRDRDYYSQYNRERDDRYGGSDRRGAYDRGYEGRGYDRGYDDRRGYGYDNRDRYSGGGSDRYYGGGGGDQYRDRYYERPRSSGGGAYDRDYDRSYARYDYRNYRPWDETYRGQSGFDKSGRGYYFANAYSGPGYLPDGKSQQGGSPCGVRVVDCGTRVSSGTINSGHTGGSGSTVINTSGDRGDRGGGSGNKGGWSYVNEPDAKNNPHRGNGGAPQSPAAGAAASSRDRPRDTQSPSYGGRAPRPLGGSYLLDREDKLVTDNNAGNGAGGAGSSNSNSNTAQTQQQQANDNAIAGGAHTDADGQQQQARDGQSAAGNAAVN